MRNAFIDNIINKVENNKNIFMITGDAGLGVFDSFKNDFPDNFLNLGVAEQNMISFASGMALTGRKVYIYNIIPFLLYRCYEQVRNDIAYHELPVVLVGIGSGVTYSPQGMTHYSVEDIGIANTLPNLQVFSPIDPIEAQAIADYSIHSKDPLYVRLAKRGEVNIHKQNILDITKPQLIRKGCDFALIVHGSIGIEALQASTELSKIGVDVTLLSMPMIKPFDINTLLPFLDNITTIITIEEHYIHNGFGSILSYECSRLDLNFKIHHLGIENKFIHAIKDNAGMRDLFGISSKKIVKYLTGLKEKNNVK